MAALQNCTPSSSRQRLRAYDTLTLFSHSFFNTLFSRSHCFSDMFTPPPSPLPPIQQASLSETDTHASDDIQTKHCPLEDTRISLSKRRIHRSIRLTIVLVPLTLVLLAAYTRFRIHPAVFDLLSTNGDHERTTWMKVADWSLHEPHNAANNRLVKRTTLVARDATTTPAPTVPVNPALPTPFPQPFDTTLSTNFSTTSCYDFFLNMTQVDAFRSCRPFSLLITNSHAFEMVISGFRFVSREM